MSSVKIIKKTSYGDGRRNHKGFQHNARLLGHAPPYSNDVKQEVTDYINRSKDDINALTATPTTESPSYFSEVVPDYINKVYERALQLGADRNGLGDVSDYEVSNFTPTPNDVRFSQSDSGKRLNEFLSQLITSYANDGDYDSDTGVTNPNDYLMDYIITPLLDNVNNNGVWNVQGLSNTFGGILVGNTYSQNVHAVNRNAVKANTSDAYGREMLAYIRSLVNRQTSDNKYYRRPSYTSLRDMQLSLQRDIVSMHNMVRQKQQAINNQKEASSQMPLGSIDEKSKNPNIQRWIKSKRTLKRITSQLQRKVDQFFYDTGFFPYENSGWFKNGLTPEEAHIIRNDAW